MAVALIVSNQICPRGRHGMGRLVQDMKFGSRFLLKRPAFTVLVVATLSLGIGASTPIFSVVNRVLIQPLPYDHAEDLVLLRHDILQSRFVDGPVPPADVIDFREQVNVFDGIAATDRTFEANLTGDGAPEVVRVARVTSNFFDVLGVDVELGRTFSPEEIAGSIREVMSDLDPEIPLSAVRPLSAYVADATALVRFATGLIGLFALVALILAAIGVYGVVSSSVRQSTREIGLRLALGAPHPRLVRSVVGRGIRLAILRLAAGLLVSLGLARLTSNLLTGVSPTDTLTYAVVAALLLIITVFASLAPARLAIHVDPMEALRYE
ncbi:MAG: ABC transporter permease [Gemmatimonadales bacterium]|nr:MAG: ABC transporter permease [Gemmatimonadales bacterium]